MSQLEFLHGGCNKRRKRSVPSDQRVFRFKSFCEPGYPTEFDGPFWNNVKSLLEFGNMENHLCANGMVSWSFQLEVHRHRPDHRVFLFVIQEPVEGSIYRYCRHCRYIGWGQHMICNIKYHFVVPSTETAAMVSTCSTCQGNYCCDETAIATTCGSRRSTNLVELEGHLLHGVFHCNGFGHLLCVNGLEMGSDLTGHQIMDFWDRICTGLRARKVSLMDVAQKKGMELRLLHGVAYGGSWFTRWDYKFGRGSFGVTEPMYQKSIQASRNISLCVLLHHLSSLDSYLLILFSRYQALSDHSLTTLGDLFHFMLELRFRLPKEAVPTDLFNPGILLETSCRWSPKRVEMATRVIVETLKRAEPKWVSRQDVRDAARVYIGDTGLLDFVLKSLGNHVVGKYLVHRSLNPVTKVLEYCLEDISVGPDHVPGLMKESKSNMMVVTRVQLAKDILYLYKSTLGDRRLMPTSGPGSTISIASRVILDSKHLIKEFDYHPRLPRPTDKFGTIDQLIDVLCTLNLKQKHLMLPSEDVRVKGNMTMLELKKEVEKCFKEMYLGLQGLVVESIININNVTDNDYVCRVTKEGKDVVLQGGIGNGNGNGNGNLIGWNEIEVGEYHNQGHGYVDCACGAKEDDGERMVACDICEVWQHTRCVRIPSHEEVPRIFLCDRCEQDIVLSSSLIM